MKVREEMIADLALLNDEVLGLLRFHDTGWLEDQFVVQVAVKVLGDRCYVAHDSSPYPQRSINQPPALPAPNPERLRASRFCASAELKPLLPTTFSVPA